MIVSSLNSGLGTSLYKSSTTISKSTEQSIMVYYHRISKVTTNKLAMRKPTMLPALDFDDQIPTILPSFFTLNWLLKMVKVAGKKLSWKNPKTPKLHAIRR